ncbi:hypothetical protein BB560_006882 [Smittium megazygosporum]|uniref:ABC transporter domain-containing protein n=1 Tax=Smittium megazygosporum TaxID=133381 RepID=A0A2T9Y0K3_9FUNG|nr:hypothetical protein BB560_006882 [Smittium megazygosporum]
MALGSSFANPTNSTTFAIGAAFISGYILISNYMQHKTTSIKLQKTLGSSKFHLSSSYLNSQKSSRLISNNKQNLIEDKFDKDSVLFIEQEERSFSAQNQPQPHTKKIGSVDKVFLQRFKILLKILIPSWHSREVLIIALHSIFLLIRTYLSVVIAQLDGRIVSYLIQSKGKKFLGGILSWLLIAIPATYTNSMIKYLESKLSISFRTRLFNYINSLYLNERNTFYKLANLDNRIRNPEQYITTDVTRFSSLAASIFSNIGKPTIDMFIFHSQLIKSVGLGATSSVLGFYFISVYILRKISPPFGKLIAKQAEIEGRLRSNHSRVATNAEEISFYKGDSREKFIVESSLQDYTSHKLYFMWQKFAHVIYEDMIIKYIWSAIGYMVCAFPYFFDEFRGYENQLTSAKRMQNFITNKRIMLNISEAGGRLMNSSRQLMELSGLTERVYSLLYVLHSLRIGHYPYQNSTNSNLLDNSKTITKMNNQRNQLYIERELTQAGARGVVYEDFAGIKLTYVPIVVPNLNPYLPGEVLVQPLIWNVRPGEHWFVKGPGGIGKTSLLRIISNIWPVFSGVLEKPPSNEISYVPSRAYLCIGTLRDQIIYPDSKDKMKENGCTDENLLEILKVVNLEFLPGREGGFDAFKEWKDVLSGGEQQRICMARLFYHQPNFAILDECTSAVSVETEGKMYTYAKDIGITLVTISHRSSLSKYHRYMLRLGDSYASKMPSLGVKMDNLEANNLMTGLTKPEDMSSYAGPAWSDAELAALDESEEIIRATLNNHNTDPGEMKSLGAAWQTVQLTHSNTQPDYLYSPSYSKTELDSEVSVISEQQSRDEKVDEQGVEDGSKKHKKQMAKSEYLKLKSVVNERKKTHNERLKQLALVEEKLTRVMLDPKIAALLT